MGTQGLLQLSKLKHQRRGVIVLGDQEVVSVAVQAGDTSGQALPVHLLTRNGYAGQCIHCTSRLTNTL
eukprot:9220807-Heterocapsa_arctica.AAC.1